MTLSLCCGSFLASGAFSLNRHPAPGTLGWEVRLLVPLRRAGILHLGWNSHWCPCKLGLWWGKTRGHPHVHITRGLQWGRACRAHAKTQALVWE